MTVEQRQEILNHLNKAYELLNINLDSDVMESIETEEGILSPLGEVISNVEALDV